jgi:hypothetical protein
MKSFFKRISLTLAVMVGVTLASTSCVKENLEDCPPLGTAYNVMLHIITNFDAGIPEGLVTYDQFNIESMAIFIFDEQGQFVDVLVGDPYTPGKDYAISLNLEPGKYQFVVVTNPGDMNEMPYTPDEFREMRPSLDEIEMAVGTDVSRVDMDIEDLHLGKSGVVTVSNENPQDVTVVVYPKTYKVNFRAIGLPADHTYEFEVSDHNFMRSIDGESFTTLEDMINYWREGVLTNENPRTYFDASMTMYDFNHDKEMPFVLRDTTTGEIVFSGDLIDMIEQAYNTALQEVDFNQIFEFDITLNFAAGTQIEITVNGWTYRIENTNL